MHSDKMYTSVIFCYSQLAGNEDVVPSPPRII